jgi:pyruvate/2-oxoglutarate dehydrogenase complex dihydrolipoamide acyltransferase (E2) component
MPSVEGEEEPRPLSRMRRVIADRLTHSWTTTPHFTVTMAVDVTALLALRAELKGGGTNLTVTDFVLAATAQTLAEFPDATRTDGFCLAALVGPPARGVAARRPVVLVTGMPTDS